MRGWLNADSVKRRTRKPGSDDKLGEQVQEVIGFIVAVDKLITHATGDAAASLSLIYIFFYYQQSERSQQKKKKTREKRSNRTICRFCTG